ncbi:MAG: hypothetical protein EA357_01165 [Micavibrio sp.]|nr:MAG: hypothetical protein EA357_01165 [Micavibrio sp.]
MNKSFYFPAGGVQNLLVVVFLAAVLSGCASTERVAKTAPSQGTEDAKQKNVEIMIAEHNFLGLFRNARDIADRNSTTDRGRNFVISSAVIAYFDAHQIVTPEQAIDLLMSRGFKAYHPREYERRYNGNGSSEAVIYAVKRNGGFNPFVQRRYKIHMHIKDGRVSQVSASSAVASPLQLAQ